MSVAHVAGTKIFARDLGNGRQALIYSMDVAAKQPVAMVLPLPIALDLQAERETAVQFVDLSGYPEFFTDLSRAFSPELGLAKARAFGAQSLTRSRLVVHEVGDFVASYVPSERDFSRLDPRFRLDPATIAKLPDYTSAGFAVFQLKGLGQRRWFGLRAAKSEVKSIHPMAFTFPRRTEQLFFPTVHVHDGELHPEAKFDHELYAQGLEQPGPDWQRADHPLPYSLAMEPNTRSKGLFDPSCSLHRKTMVGTFANKDVYVGGNQQM